MIRSAPRHVRCGRFAWLLILIGFVVACRRPEAPELTPADIVAQSAARMAGTAGFHFVIDQSGAPAFLDPDNILALRRAEGDYAAPDRARATVRVAAPGFVTDVDVISIGATQWQTNLLTGAWEALPPEWGFNPAVLFDREVGLPAILTADLTDLQTTEPEQLPGSPGGPLYVLTGTAAGERLHQMSGGLIGPHPVTVKLWIAPETFELYRALVTDPGEGADEPGIWQVDFTNFDQAVTIEPPA